MPATKETTQKKTTSKKDTKKATPQTLKKATKKTNQKDHAPEDFAVIKTGGKQYIVSQGDVITIEKLSGEYKKGDTVVFDEVLLVDDGKDTTDIGEPFIDGAKVEGELQSIGRNKRIDVVQYKSKSRYYRRKGHKQPHMKVKITKIK